MMFSYFLLLPCCILSRNGISVSVSVGFGNSPTPTMYSLSKEQEIADSTLKCEDQTDIHFFSDSEIERLQTAAVMAFSNGKPCLKQAEFFVFMLNTGLSLARH